MNLKSIFKFLKSYKLLSFVTISLIVSLILFLFSYGKISDWILGVTVIIAVLPLLWDMVETLRNGKFGIDILAATAMITSIALGQYWTGIIIALMLTGGEALEDYAENRAKKELKSLLDNKPKQAHLIKGKETIDIEVGKVAIGNKLSILPGELVPVDCVLIEGDTSVDESSITGESLPVDKIKGSEILSGSVNIEGSIIVKVLRTAENSQYEQIIKLVKAATSTESPFVRLADRYSIPFTIIAYLIAGSVWFISGEAIRFLEVIVVATPCPLLLAAPIALISGMSRATKHGIIIKNGLSLEKLAQVKTVGFDKTGTLTSGQPSIEKIIPFNDYKKVEILKAAATLEQKSNHILARIIVSEANRHNIKLSSIKQVKESAGKGLEGRIQGKDVLVGKYTYMIDNQVKIPEKFSDSSIDTTASYVAISGELAGIITFIDQLRPESYSMLDRLKNAGIKNFLVVTGDNESVAHKISAELGIANVKANCLPGDKMHYVEAVTEKPVAFVGDGVNDAPVLTIADVGIALGARGSTAASESADVVIMLDDVSKVASSIEIAKRTFFIAKQSILIGILISIALMLVFATGKFKPIYGAILQEVVDVFVIFNALRAHGAWQKIVDSENESSL
jgi:heavy metal translocating P-type ATPase